MHAKTSGPLPAVRPLAGLEQYVACLRRLGAPDDAHPKVGVNDNCEIIAMICVVERRTPLELSLPWGA